MLKRFPFFIFVHALLIHPSSLKFFKINPHAYYIASYLSKRWSSPSVRTPNFEYLIWSHWFIQFHPQNLHATLIRRIYIWVFRAQADWTLIHTSHKAPSQSTIEAPITLDGVTLTGDHRINDLQFAGRYHSVCR
jgi:hypothetical protein